MQINILVKDLRLAQRIKKFRERNYPHLPITKLFVHAVVELMKREEEN